ncbi:hypothetical protein GALMADRAFT_881315 [Galerina marginata CBS 339.88]|uniref:Uncharacterized protein n=1 Tax=Galerina marginata (strain CBS 339.88) TaxID=685588 RepID=A0A067SIF3_GALM3|nr:hypothetical protein GALMADRAFT_881315 [Galerina marginata CBS 339.88]
MLPHFRYAPASCIRSTHPHLASPARICIIMHHVRVYLVAHESGCPVFQWDDRSQAGRCHPASCTTHHAPRTMHHAPRTTHHSPAPRIIHLRHASYTCTTHHYRLPPLASRILNKVILMRWCNYRLVVELAIHLR